LQLPTVLVNKTVNEYFENLEGAKSSDYNFTFDSGQDFVRIHNNVANTAWTVKFEVTDEGVALADFSDWTVEEGETEPPRTPRTEVSDLEQARRLRGLRLAQPSTTKRKGSNMPLTREELAALELSDDAREAIQSVLDENIRLSAKTREAECEHRLNELKELGLSERPGALKFYRDIYLSDDGGPAVVLSDADGNEKTRLTALEVLDKFIEGVKGSDGKVNLSNQHLVSSNDVKPPAETESENGKPVEDRLAEARESLYGKK
jgi:hypothetical protein